MKADVGGVLAAARAAGLGRLDAQLLLAHHLARPRSWVIANEDAPIAPAILDRLRADIAGRATGVPLAYLTGHREFHGLDLRLTRDVLVPRPQTEVLVDWALELLDGPLSALDAPAIVDLGTGSGAVAIAVAARCGRARVLATDASAAALRVAEANADALGLPLRCMFGDWWTAAAGERFHLALSNPPYIAAGDPHLAALRHEPAQALVAGADGFDAIHAIAVGAGTHLHAGGWLLLEHGHEQQRGVAALLEQHGFGAIETRRDLADLPRCTGGRLGG